MTSNLKQSTQAMDEVALVARPARCPFVAHVVDHEVVRVKLVPHVVSFPALNSKFILIPLNLLQWFVIQLSASDGCGRGHRVKKDYQDCLNLYSMVSNKSRHHAILIELPS